MQRDDDARAGRHAAHEVQRLQPEIEQVVEMDDVGVEARDEGGEFLQAPGIELREVEAVEMAEPDQHLIGVATGGLEQRARAPLTVLGGDGAEEKAIDAVAVTQLPEQPARHHLGAAGLQIGVVVTEDEDAHGWATLAPS